MLHQEELRRVFDTFQALFASVHSLVDKRDFYDTYRPILGEPVDPAYSRSRLQPIPLTADPTYGRSHLRPIPLTADPTSRKELQLV